MLYRFAALLRPELSLTSLTFLMHLRPSRARLAHLFPRFPVHCWNSILPLILVIDTFTSSHTLGIILLPYIACAITSTLR